MTETQNMHLFFGTVAWLRTGGAKEHQHGRRKEDKSMSSKEMQSSGAAIQYNVTEQNLNVTKRVCMKRTSS